MIGRESIILKKIKDKKIKIKPMQAESFETTLERYGQGRLFQINDNLSKAKKNNRVKHGCFAYLYWPVIFDRPTSMLI